MENYPGRPPIENLETWARQPAPNLNRTMPKPYKPNYHKLPATRPQKSRFPLTDNSLLGASWTLETIRYILESDFLGIPVSEIAAELDCEEIEVRDILWRDGQKI
jgi:hypothetical protein